MIKRYTIQPNGCWNWSGPVDKDGYGKVKHEGRMYQANNLQYILTYGSLKPGMQVHHKCENKACINPEHLEALAQPEHKAKHSRFKEEDLPLLAHLYKTCSAQTIAAYFNTSVTTVTKHLKRAGVKIKWSGQCANDIQQALETWKEAA